MRPTTCSPCRGTAAIAATVFLLGCGGSNETDEQRVARAMQQTLQTDIDSLHQSALAMQAAAPVPDGRGWDATVDTDAIAAMKAAWVDARTTYEHIEGAVAPIFPDLDTAIDQRYDGFLAMLAGQGDSDLFDGKGVIGMHAVERILYLNVTPPRVVAFESSIPGYAPAAFPATADQAAELKKALCAQLVTDTEALVEGWMATRNLDAPGAFQGLIGLMNEQQEKVNNAGTGGEESRYSQRTMADLRDNLDGTVAIYGLFRTWLQSKPAAYGAPDGVTVDASIVAGFDALRGTYGSVDGDAIPTPPPTWSSVNPSATDLETPFGQLYQAIHQAVDPNQPGSIVQNMNTAALLLRIPGFAG